MALNLLNIPSVIVCICTDMDLVLLTGAPQAYECTQQLKKNISLTAQKHPNL